MRNVLAAMLLAACSAPAEPASTPAPVAPCAPVEASAPETRAPEPDAAEELDSGADAAPEASPKPQPDSPPEASAEPEPPTPEPHAEAGPDVCVPSEAACLGQCGGAAWDGCGALIVCPYTIADCCRPDPSATPCHNEPGRPAGLNCDWPATNVAVPPGCVTTHGGTVAPTSYCCAAGDGG